MTEWLRIVTTKILWLEFITLGVLLGLLASYGHCAISKKHDNSIGSLMYEDNPMSYVAGSVRSIAYVDGGKAISVRVQPIGTYSLYTDEKLFCGSNVVERFRNVANPMVLTYRTKASRLIESVGCHELVSVDGLKPKELQ
jgi:hypothetical protein